MKITTRGHLYELENFERSQDRGQSLQFIEKHRDTTAAAPGALITVRDGTTNEEVLRVLIDRMNYLQSSFPCRENAIAQTYLETALLWLEKRTEDRKARGIEGKQLP
jgi:hypothetical protein